MLYGILSDKLGENKIIVLTAVAAFILTFILLARPFGFLPRDGGKFVTDKDGNKIEVNKGSSGKVTGVGLLMVIVWLLLIFLLVLIQIVCIMSVPYFIYIAFDMPHIAADHHMPVASLFDFLCIQSFVLFTSNLVPLPGASGGAELAFSMYFSAYFVLGGVNKIKPAILLWRFITYYGAMLLTAPFSYYTKGKKKTSEINKSVLDVIAAEAEVLINERPHQRAYVLYQPHWHVGVVGIVAGRLTRKYHCPIFVLGEHNGFAKGSGRSIEEVNLTELFPEVQPLLRHWGGHPAAAGLEVEIENILPLEVRLNEILLQKFQGDWSQPTLSIASVLSETSLTEDFLDELEHLAPFGQGNEMPIFALKDVILTEPAERFGKHNAHLRLTLNGHRAVGWGMGDARIPQNKPLDFAVQLGWSCWNGRRTLQIQVIDWRVSGSEE